MATQKDSLDNRSDAADTNEKKRRKPSDQRENSFNFLAWAVEGATGLAEELRYNDLGLSEDFWEHLYAARRESLFTARAFLDSLIERSESDAIKEEERGKRRERRGGINIDF